MPRLPAPRAADQSDAALARVAFGPDPGARELPAPSTPDGRWLRAVALGGQGRYAAARTELARIARTRPHPVLASLASSTEASLLRQLGWHRQAAGYDGRALVLLESAPAAGVDVRAARGDALTGLAADALGCGRLDLGFRLLARCEGLLDAPDPGLWRQRIRLNWVTAEMSLAAGDAARGHRHAGLAVELARDTDSVRHQVKSRLLLAAAVSAGPDAAAAAAPAAEIVDSCAGLGLVPLRWAAAMLLNGVRPSAEAAAVRDECERQIRDWGGRFRNL
ncbi:hypothetical protein [Rhodococcus kronopolitis]|uniref:Uncharacterized protein n=1 Tax=Rhodococcus kronopolitis TaxID=1460226 RepID=A0ABV9FLW1_9NOCA